MTLAARAILVLAFQTAAATAVAGPFDRTVFEPNRYPDLRKIDLYMKIGPSVSITLDEASSAWALGGAIGGAIGGTREVQANKECAARLTEVIQGRVDDFETELAQSLTLALEKSGYKVNFLKGRPLPRDAETKKVDFKGFSAESDGAMYASISAFAFGKKDGRIIPTVGADFFLYSPQEEKLIYRQTFTVGRHLIKAPDVQKVDMPNQATFGSRDDICVDPLLTVGALKAMAVAVMPQVAAGLSK
jgi:hypothetical protein